MCLRARRWEGTTITFIRHINYPSTAPPGYMSQRISQEITLGSFICVITANDLIIRPSTDANILLLILFILWFSWLLQLYIHIHSIIHRTMCCFCWSADAERPICPSCPVPNLPRSLHDGKPTSRNVNFKLERYASCSHRPGQASTHITIKHPELTVIYLACLDVWSLLLSLFYVLQYKTIDFAFAKYLE